MTVGWAAALLLAFARAQPAAATEPDTFSPIVSYQFQESLATPDTPTTITSPVVSYQYFDWIGDENVTFQYSPNVSFHFSGGVSLAVSGTVRTTTGLPVAGTTITLKRYGTVFWTGTSAANGTFAAANLQAANFTVTVTKTGFTTLVASYGGEAGGSQTVDLRLAAAPPPPSLVTTNQTPATTAIRAPAPTDPANPNAPRLKVFNGTQFIEATTSLDPSRMTVVISHGWKSSPNDWATTLASQIRNRLGAQAVNIVTWDWNFQANTKDPPIDEACTQGENLGKALRQVLGTGYSQHLHFIGHSLGTIVNANACDYVHGSFPRNAMNPPNPRWLASQTRPHVTLLDEAEVASVFGQNVTTAAAIGWKAAQLKGALLVGGAAAVANWKSPIPRQAWWVDNYISAVGIQHDEAVNVCLVTPTVILDTQTLQSLKLGMEYAHSYSHQWYRNTVSPPGSAAPIGFGSSLESGAAFPPSGTGTAAGSLWWENIDTTDAFDISLTRPDLGGLVDVAFTGDFPILFGLTVVAGSQAGNGLVTQPLDALGRSVLSGYEMGIQFAGNVGGTVIYKTGEVISETSEKVGLWWDAARDQAADVLNSLNPETLITGPLAAPVFKIRLRTQAAPQPLAQNAKISGPAASSAGQPSYAWVSVNVPADAGLMAFDFTVTGDPQDDQIACAINEQNVFTLAAKFAPDGQTVSTDLIDVSAYAGQTVQLFFGLVGGSSTNCEVAIDGVRFITVPSPNLAIGAAGPNIVLKWPAAATGWVLETSSSLAPGSWQEVPPTTGVTVDRGVATMEQPMSGSKKFFRLRRNP